MDCKIKVKDPALANVLGADEFDGFSAFETALPVGTELLVSDRAGHFVVRFRKYSFSGGSLKLLYDSDQGRGEVRPDEIIGRATPDVLRANEDGLDDISRAKLVVLPGDAPPTDIPSQTEAVVYDPEASKIKMEQFESTTGQDVKSEEEGTLDERPSTLAKMALRQAIAESPYRYRYFIVKDSPDYYNDPGIEPTGEVLLVVHSAAYESLQAELGRTPTQEELKEVAVKIQGNTISGEGPIYTLPLEGTTGGGASFFERNHDERVVIYADKYGVSIAEAEQHFRDGYERMAQARERATTAPVEVRVKSVSQGSPVNHPMDTDNFVKKHKLTGVTYSTATNKSKVVGRVYLSGQTPDGTTVEMLTVPKGVIGMYGLDFIWETYINAINPDFLGSIFGTNRRQRGPYMSNGVLMFQGTAIENVDSLAAALSESDWPMLTNKVNPDGVSVMFTDGEFVTVPNTEFIAAHTETDGDLWKHKGKPVPYLANRYLYLNIGTPAPVEVVRTSGEQLQRATAGLFEDPKEYDRVSISTEPEDIAVKVMLPHLFSKAFLGSQSYPRLRKREKIGVKQEGALTISYPVGGRYFGSKSVAKRKIRDVLVAYVGAGVKLPFPSNGDVFAEFDAYIQNKVDAAIKEGIDLETFETQANGLYTHFSNEFVAQLETGILSVKGDTTGNFGEVTLSYWQQQQEGSSFSEYYTDQPVTPTPVARVMRSKERYITLDAFRTLSRSNGTWTEAQEKSYQKQVKDLNEGQEPKDAPIQVTLAYSGPSNVRLDGNGSVASFEQTDTGPQVYTVVGPGSELGRQMLSEGYDVASPDFGTTAALPWFYVPAQAVENERDRFLQSLEPIPVRAIPSTEVYEYAVLTLGKNFAQKLFSSGQAFTFADINSFREDIGKPFSFTKFLPKRDLAVSKNSSEKILEGTKTITLRNSEARYANKSGLVEIEGEVFDFQEIGNMGFEKALAVTVMTQQEFAKAFFGEDKGIDSVFDEGVRAFFEGSGTRRVYTIKKLGATVDPRKRKSKKKPIPC